MTFMPDFATKPGLFADTPATSCSSAVVLPPSGVYFRVWCGAPTQLMMRLWLGCCFWYTRLVPMSGAARAGGDDVFRGGLEI